MAAGLPYDSAEGRNYAAAITSLMCGQAYLQSARVAERMGSFAGYPRNAESMLRAIRKHRKCPYQIASQGVGAGLLQASLQVWDDAFAEGTDHGFPKTQVTAPAPTPTTRI